MIAPLDEQIAEALMDRLKTIQAGVVIYNDPATTNEYFSTPKTFTRSLFDMDQYKAEDSYPLIGLVRGSGSSLARDMHMGSISGQIVWERRDRYVVWGYVQGDHESVPDGVIADTQLRRLRADTMTCLLTAGNFGGLLTLLQPDGECDTDDGALEPRAFFAQPWLAVSSDTLRLA